MSFYGAQAFFVFPGIVQNAPEVGISGIDLFFSAKPNANNNASGIAFPGVTVSLVPTVNGIPDVTRMLNAPLVRVNYTDINVDPSANIATRFEFLPPVQVCTNSYYAFVVQLDDPGYRLWGVTVGQPIVGTTNVATGPSGSYVGGFYDFLSPVPVANNGIVGNSSIQLTGNGSTNSAFADQSAITGSWTTHANFDLKFTVYAARYTFNGNNQLSSFVSVRFPANAQITAVSNVTHNTATGETVFTLPAGRYEYVDYSPTGSSNVGVQVGERVFQNTVFYPGGSTPANVSVITGSNRLTAIANQTVLNFSTLFVIGGLDPEYIVVTSGNASGNGASIINVRQVVGFVSNSVVIVDEPFSFTNTNATFFRTPIAKVSQWMTGKLFGNNQTVVVMSNSTSNSSMRFVNDSIIAVSVNDIGVGYNNTDYFEVTGFESVAGKVLGGYKANGTINTFSNSSIQNVYLTNVGCGFVNSAVIVVSFKAANGAASNGSTATLATTVGSTLAAEFLGITGGGGYFTNCKMINIEIGNEVVGLGVNNPFGTGYHASEYLPYYSVDDGATVAGKVFYCDPSADADVIPVTFNQTVYPWFFTKRRSVMSWSNELITPYTNGSISSGTGGFPGGTFLPDTSNSSILFANVVSNCDFSSVALAPDWSTITFSRYIINDDYTAENTNSGNAWAKGIEVSFNLANSNIAEDIVVYSTCYRPAVSNIIMYARMFNSADPEQFTSKDWTMLELTGGATEFSSMTDPTDGIELTWGLQPYPNNTPLAGSVKVNSGDTTIVGSGTTFHTNVTTNLSAGDLVVIYQPLFANLDYFVATVASVTNDTQIVLNQSTTNNDVLGAGMSIAKVTYPHQAFKNAQNSNIVRYFNSQGVPFDGFNVCQMKVVMISSNGTVVPILSDVRTVAVSA